MKAARFRAVAKAELREAAAWYRERDETVARRFLAEVRTSVEFVESFPGTGAPVPGVGDDAIRRLPVHGFPYHVVFIELETRTRYSLLRMTDDDPGTGAPDVCASAVPTRPR